MDSKPHLEELLYKDYKEPKLNTWGYPVSRTYGWKFFLKTTWHSYWTSKSVPKTLLISSLILLLLNKALTIGSILMIKMVLNKTNDRDHTWLLWGLPLIATMKTLPEYFNDIRSNHAVRIELAQGNDL